MNYEEILNKLRNLSDPEAVKGMAKFGINPENTYGISIPDLRNLAKKIGKDHQLAEKLWESGIHEARILASMIDDPTLVTEKQMDDWIKDFDSWDVCDQVCMNLFDKTNIAFQKAVEWTKREKEFEKRAGFALMACLAWHDKNSKDDRFEVFLKEIIEGSTDNRNFVKKAVNWALRQIGKRNLNLNLMALKTAKEIEKIENKSAKWIAKDAIKELSSKKVEERLKNKTN